MSTLTPEPVVLDTERLRLRSFIEADIETWARDLYADPEVTRFLPGADVSPLERTRRFYDFVAEHWARHGFGIWAVTDRASGALLGQCGLSRVEELQTVELDYSLAQAAWGRGLASEAAGAAVRHAFETLRLPALIALVMHGNDASVRVAERLGFQYERDVQLFGVELKLHGLSAARYRAAG
jgi:[ribosomal protein S5]-alanine N-acetyltransferase